MDELLCHGPSIIHESWLHWGVYALSPSIGVPDYPSIVFPN